MGTTPSETLSEKMVSLLRLGLSSRVTWLPLARVRAECSLTDSQLGSGSLHMEASPGCGEFQHQALFVQTRGHCHQYSCLLKPWQDTNSSVRILASPGLPSEHTASLIFIQTYRCPILLLWSADPAASGEEAQVPMLRSEKQIWAPWKGGSRMLPFFPFPPFLSLPPPRRGVPWKAPRPCLLLFIQLRENLQCG